jgi:hypothetical protein
MNMLHLFRNQTHSKDNETWRCLRWLVSWRVRISDGCTTLRYIECRAFQTNVLNAFTAIVTFNWYSNYIVDIKSSDNAKRITCLFACSAAQQQSTGNVNCRLLFSFAPCDRTKQKYDALETECKRKLSSAISLLPFRIVHMKIVKVKPR